MERSNGKLWFLAALLVALGGCQFFETQEPRSESPEQTPDSPRDSTERSVSETNPHKRDCFKFCEQCVVGEQGVTDCYRRCHRTLAGPCVEETSSVLQCIVRNDCDRQACRAQRLAEVDCERRSGAP
jgi:hypothetical protein